MPGASETEELAEYWQIQINRWRTSGESQSSFCKAHELSYHRFTYWRRKFEDRPTEPGGFALVRCQSGVASHLSVALPNGLVVQGIGADNLAVARQLLESLR
ncbi:MAG: IS66 family insertion sequence hypothetical protein [Gammaproteobacteria bacterium]|nr:MAG: IS66 family insertion sequence hypothetical protein [Gammaproteobacteria bacterium]